MKAISVISQAPPSPAWLFTLAAAAGAVALACTLPLHGSGARAPCAQRRAGPDQWPNPSRRRPPSLRRAATEFYAAVIAPSGARPSATKRQIAIKSLRAKATIVVRRIRP
jgi:hypothetical protein